MPSTWCYIRDKMNRMLSEYTGQPLEKIQQDTERDNYMYRAAGKGIRPDR